MKTTISNIGLLKAASKGKTSMQSCAKMNLFKAECFHKYITERLPFDILIGMHSGYDYTSTRLTWDNEKITLKELSKLN